MSQVPIRNIYYLLCYAWNHVEETDVIPTQQAAFERVHDLLGFVLARAVSRLISRGLDRSYIVESAAVSGVRGKLDLSRTLKERTLWSGRTWCSFDEFHHDILPNRILKASLETLLQLNELDEAVRVSVRAARDHLGGVRSIQLRQEHFRRLQLHRNNRLSDFALRVCRLLFESMIVDGGTGTARFHDFIRDEARMGRLFEDFVFNFYDREQRFDRVSRPQIRWHDARGSADDLRYLPIMRTDVVLSRSERVLVIDTKFYVEALVSRFHREKVRSSHLYQILTYLENISRTVERPVEGLLLYPSVGEPFGLDFRLDGRRVRVVSLDLGQSWEQIHADLLALP
ncbi:MAG: hypothetical protein L0271_05985 [Gemmatimonadetes bacterium]|nr:hypothetical protein [Gemmatimonadota bacterium]